MIRCAECKHAYVGKAINNTLTHYVCALRHRSFSNIEKTCRQKSVRCDLADQAAWDFVKEWLSDKQKFEKLLRDGQREELESLAPKHEELAAIVGMLVGCEKEAAQYARALAKASGVVGQTLEAQIQEVNARYDALCKRRDELKAELSAQRMSNEAIEEAMQFREDVAAGMDNPDFETKRRILELLKVEVKVKDGKCRVGFRPRIVSTSS